AGSNDRADSSADGPQEAPDEDREDTDRPEGPDSSAADGPEVRNSPVDGPQEAPDEDDTDTEAEDAAAESEDFERELELKPDDPRYDGGPWEQGSTSEISDGAVGSPEASRPEPEPADADAHSADAGPASALESPAPHDRVGSQAPDALAAGEDVRSPTSDLPDTERSDADRPEMSPGSAEREDREQERAADLNGTHEDPGAERVERQQAEEQSEEPVPPRAEQERIDQEQAGEQKHQSGESERTEGQSTDEQDGRISEAEEDARDEVRAKIAQQTLETIGVEGTAAEALSEAYKNRNLILTSPWVALAYAKDAWKNIKDR
ncbi:hypothetical protein ACFOW4_15460, partial [Micromonospora sp. GCM10011542]|uniref:hypothetical protein n=1 Tax=Micromonospora sp. GCM10011542 TaxID=3317337 RepID=UPI0036202E58